MMLNFYKETQKELSRLNDAVNKIEVRQGNHDELRSVLIELQMAVLGKGCGDPLDYHLQQRIHKVLGWEYQQ